MTESDTDLLPISNFSRMTLLSAKALRLYDQLGVLKPAHTDPGSGYRYYRSHQLREANLIRFMRRMDMPLTVIREVLASSPEEAERLVEEYLRRLEARATRARLTIPNLVSALHDDQTLWIPEIYVRTVQPQPIVSTSCWTMVDGLDQQVRISLDRLHAFIREQGATPAGKPFGIYHGQVSEEDGGPVEVCVPVGQELPGAAEIGARVLPDGQLACVVLRGNACRFPAVLNGYDALYDWIEYNGYEADGPPYEIWRSGRDERWAELEIAWRFRDPVAQ